jgi:hypothetical protein
MTDLSILIPARNEMFLAKTVKDILEHARGDTEIIVVLDGPSSHEPVPDDPRVQVIALPEPIGQRQATNLAARMSTAKFVMKVDAHCSFSDSFDVALMADCEYDWTMVPEMRNLHVFDWQCVSCGHRSYQGPAPARCKKCGGDEFEMVMVWKPRPHTRNRHMRFDRELHFQYWRQFKRRPEGKGKLVPTMSLVGACWMMHRERYWELGGLDEGHGSWGQMGTEIACKSWLSDGQLICSRKAWFAHLFRTQKGFGFPYPLSGNDTRKAREYSQRLWRAESPDEMPLWDGAIYPLSWLVEKFWPVPDWHDTKGIVYYTDNRLNGRIDHAVKAQLAMCANGYEIMSASLAPIDLGKNIVVSGERGPLTMFRQILAALEESTADIVFFCEHDCLYPPSHFEFMPERADVFYYNVNVWKVRASDGHAVKVDDCRQTSGLCAYRRLLLEHYRKRVEIVEQNGFSRKMGFEPGTHNRAERVDDYGSKTWRSEQPLIDIRHGGNFTLSRWSKDQFRNQRYTRGWAEADEVPGWGRFEDVLNDLAPM